MIKGAVKLIIFGIILFVLMWITIHNEASAQEVSKEHWSLNVVGHAGSYIALRDLGKSVGTVGSFQAIQAQGRLRPALVMGGGLEAILPDGSTWLRLAAGTTQGAQAEAQIGLCTVLTGDICDTLVVDANVYSLHGLIGLRQGSKGDRARASFFAGLGVRGYRYGEADCTPFVADPNMHTACGFMSDIFENPPTATPFLELGFEILLDVGPVDISLQASDLTGPNNGGGAGSESTMQSDVFLTAGLNVTVR